MAANQLGKVLRLAVIQGGKVIEDKTLDKRENVTIGHDGKNTLVVPMSNLPKSLVVFECKGGEYSLCFTEQMDGGVGSGQGEKIPFSALKSQGVAKKRGELYVVPLNDQSKGNLVLGEVKLLFQFVNPPKVVPKIELPADARGSLLNTIDRTFTGILAAFLIVELAGAFAISRMPVPNEEVTLEELPDRFVKLVAPKKPEEPPKPKEDPNANKPKDEEKKQETAEKKAIDSTPKNTQAHKEAVANAVQKKGLLKLLGAAGGDGSSGVADVFGTGDAATNVADALAGAGGVQQANGDTVAGQGVKGGGSGKAAGIGDLNTGGGGTVATAEKKDVGVHGRVLDATAEVETSDLDKAALSRFIKARLTAIQGCYEAQLKRNSSLKGRIVVRFTISPTGRVSEVDIDENQMGNDEVASCIKAKIRAWTTPFKPESDATVSYPFVFSPAS